MFQKELENSQENIHGKVYASSLITNLRIKIFQNVFQKFKNHLRVILCKKTGRSKGRFVYNTHYTHYLLK